MVIFIITWQTQTTRKKTLGPNVQNQHNVYVLHQIAALRTSTR